MLKPRIAIPIPHGGDREYAERAILQYEEAVRLAGGEPIRIELLQMPAEITRQLERCDGVLLPGSKADIDPRKYHADRHPKANPADPKRDAVDGVLIESAYKTRRPILAICYGLQSLNVHRGGTLVQHIESELNHSPGRAVPHAHDVEIRPGSRLAAILGTGNSESTIPVNSSHHQSADVIADGLRLVARSPLDGVAEALEGNLPDHFVLAVQWHPERSVKERKELGDSARAIFKAFIEAARTRQGEAQRTPASSEANR
jgi:putative glutamine amidotransferase